MTKNSDRSERLDLGSDQPKILIVDDEIGVRTLLSIMLERNGYGVVTAEDSEHAITELNTQKPPDLILLDVMMPGMNGIELCKWIRTQSQSEDTPIVILSARSDPEVVEESMDAGANDYLTKPVLTSNLIDCVRHNLGGST